jgi:glycosyltransferase involved in cell wall biosynthesis
MTLSAIVITKNEETAIRRCLESVAWADEIVVVDSGSTDRTVGICEELGAKVHSAGDWPGFGAQKNRALDLARGDWVLSLDADEWLSPGLQSEIRATVNGPTDDYEAYRIPRLSSFCGKFMRHSGWWPDRVLRLFRRGRARFSDDLVHERLIVQGSVGALSQLMLHESFASLEEVLDKINRYSSAGAQMMLAEGRAGSLTSAVAHGAWTFVRTYFLKAGFMDGREGFMLSVSNAEGVYYRYLKAGLLGKR